MANDVISAATGNFTAAGSWGIVDGTSLLDSEAGSTAVSTSNLDSSTFVLPATAVDGVALKLAGRAASPTGTFTVSIRNSTSPGTRDGSVTVNVSDLPSSGNGWVFFKITSFTPNGTDSYLIRVVCSNTGSQVTLFRNATSNNWSRRVRNTTTQAPAAGQHILVCNELTGAGTSNAITITFDNTATTSFGPTVSGGPPQGVVVSGGGTLTLGTASSTAYYFKWKGMFLICGNGTVNFGSSGSRIDTTSSLVLEMDSVAAIDSLLNVQAGGTLNCYGATKTGAVKLTADLAAAGTGLTVEATSGWQNSDQVALTPTRGTATHFERATISTVNSSTSMTLSAGVTNAHDGTSPIQGYAVNLTRNIKFRGVGTGTGRGKFKHSAGGGTTVLDSVEFDLSKLGATNDFCVDMQNTTGSFTMTNCTANPSSASGGTGVRAMRLQGSAWNATINGWYTYDWNGYHLLIDATTTAGYSLSNLFMVGSSSQDAYALETADLGGNYSGVRVFGINSGTAGAILRPTNEDVDSSSLTFSDWEFGSNSQDALVYGVGNETNRMPVMAWSTFKFWRNAGSGIKFNDTITRLVISTLTCFANGGSNSGRGGILIARPIMGVLQINDGTFAGDSSVAQPTGIRFAEVLDVLCQMRVILNNCTFGVTSGILGAHGTSDLDTTSGGVIKRNVAQVEANNCKFTATGTSTFNGLVTTPMEIYGTHVDGGGPYLSVCGYNQTAEDNRLLTARGVVKTDTAIVNEVSPSLRMTPNNASFKLISPVFTRRCPSGKAITVAVRTRKSSSGDTGGANYNGNQQRLIVRRNDLAGISADTVLATASAGTGTWETLVGTTATLAADALLEFYVDCDGTAGWVNIDVGWPMKYSWALRIPLDAVFVNRVFEGAM